MRRGFFIFLVVAVTLIGVSSAFASWRAPVQVQVPARPSVAGNVGISFQPRGHLPHGGYYYAIIVLKYLRLESRGEQPGCAISSDMEHATYAFAHGSHRLHLALIPAKSASAQWCPRGRYEGAVYAVPHKPPCSRAYPCKGKSTGYGPCQEYVCGVVKPPSYTYPGGLPKPIDRTTRIVGHFQVQF
jgi:hypothetical protein